MAGSISKEEADRVLTLLENYHCKLNKPQDAAVQKALEKVIRLFRSNSFKALIDIQQYYREMLHCHDAEYCSLGETTTPIAEESDINGHVENEEQVVVHAS